MVTGSNNSISNGVVRQYTGTPYGNYPYDSIEYRLSKLLQYLSCRYPTEGWGSFYDQVNGGS